MSNTPTNPQPTIYGRLYSPDMRDSLYPLKAARLTLPRLERFWPTGPTMDQGEYPACVGYSGYHFLTAAPFMTRIGRQIPDPMQLYKLAQLYDEWEGDAYEGSSVRGMMRALRALGIIAEYRWAFTPDIFKSHLLHRGPLNVGTDWFGNMSWPEWRDNPKQRGLRNEAWLEPDGQYQGGHAYLVVGYSHKRDAYRIQNSWGTNWGENGRAWIAAAHMHHLVFGLNGEAASAIEVK